VWVMVVFNARWAFGGHVHFCVELGMQIVACGGYPPQIMMPLDVNEAYGEGEKPC